MRVICDSCMLDAEVERVCFELDHGTTDGMWHIRCHGEEQLISCGQLPWVKDPSIHVWSNLKPKFATPSSLVSHEGELLAEVFRWFERMRIFHRVRRAQNGHRIYRDRADVDLAIDTLLLYRKDGGE